MRKLFVFMASLLLVACMSHEEQKETAYEIFEEPQVVLSPSYTYSKKNYYTSDATQASSDIDSTYMEKQTKKLQKILPTNKGSIKQDKVSITMILPHKVVFGNNQTTLDPQFEPTLSAIAKILKEYDKTKIKIVGYTDNVGSVVSNKALSLKRANAVSNFLRLNGVNINRIVVDGLGPECPLNSNKTSQEQEKNHRIIITLTNIQ